MVNRQIKEQIEKWLEFAKEDFRVAKITLKSQIYNSTCFHCQQTVEKYFKAILLQEKKIIPKTHSLERLRLELEKIDPSWKELRKETRFLDQFYVPTRYPDALPGSLAEGLPNKNDAEKSLYYTSRIIKKAEKMVK